MPTMRSDMRCERGATPFEGSGKTMDVPAIVGIGGSLIYFIDQYYETSPYNAEFEWLDKAHPEGVGFYYLDHLTHNVHQGNMDVWFDFYGKIFNSGRSASSTSRASSPACTAAP